MIHSYFLKHQYLFIKQVEGTKIPVPARKAIDNIWITTKDILTDEKGTERIPLVKRGRPYLPYAYDSYFCEDWKNGTDDVNHDEECQICRPFDYEKYWNNCGIGFLTGSINKIVVFDIDPDKFIWQGVKGKHSADEIIDIIKMVAGELPKTWQVRTPSGGYHLYYFKEDRFPTSQSSLFGGVDILGDGAKATFPTDSNKYQWVNEPQGIPARLPMWVKDIYLPKPKKPFIKKVPIKVDEDVRSRVDLVLKRWPVSTVGNKLWCNIGYILSSLGCSDLFEEWSKTDSKGRIGTAAQFRLLNRPTDAEDPAAAFFGLAKKNGILLI